MSIDRHPSGRSARRRWLAASVILHAAALAAVAAFAGRHEPAQSPRVAVTFFQPGTLQSASRPDRPSAPKPVARRSARRALLQPPTRPIPPPVQSDVVHEEPLPSAADSSDDEGARDSLGDDAGAAPGNDGVDGGSPGGLADGGKGPALSEEQRRLIDDYARRIYRDRIAGFVRYPGAAQEAGIEGNVVLRILISRDGALRAVGVASRNANEWLSEAALGAVRAAAPYPRLPDGVGDLVEFDLPFAFHLE